jgi:hypothetical protein
MTQPYFSGQSAEESLGDVVDGSEARNDDTDFRAGGLLVSFSELSDDGCDSFFSVIPLLQSNADPGVLGVLLALPKLENTPLPSPNALEPLAPDPVGDATDAAVTAAGPLKGLVLLLSEGKRFAEGCS